MKMCDLEDLIKTAKSFQKSFVDLQFMGENYRDPKLRSKVLGFAEQYGIADVGEVSRGMYSLQSINIY